MQRALAFTQSKTKWLWIGAICVILLSRAVFLLPGYGTDADALRMVNAARTIATSGSYTASRLPGYPLPEISYALIWRAGPLAINGLTALLSTVAFVFFALTLKRLCSPDYLLAGLALVFTPVIYINSVTSMDYVWALAFLLASQYWILARKPMLAGFASGLAIGCRITSGAMLLPYLLMIAALEKENRLRYALLYTGSALAVGAIVYSPVFLKYGSGFFRFYESLPVGLMIVLRLASLEVWGLIGVIGALIALVGTWIIPGRSSSIPASTPGLLVFTWVISAGLYLIAFLRLPIEAGYLIPMVPFIILLLARALDRRMFWFFCVAVILSPFFFTLRDNHVQPAGMILADHNQRIGIDNYVESFLNRTSEMHTKSLFIVGHYLPWIEASTWETSQDNIRYLYRIDQAQYDQAISEGWSVYYLPGTQQYSLRQFGFNLVEAGAIAFDLWQ